MKKSLLALATVLAIVAGCAKENFSGSVRSHSGIKKISATIESLDATKAYLSMDEQNVLRYFWYPEEYIKVGSEEQFPEFCLYEGANTPKGMFESYEDLPESEYWFACSPSEVVVKSVDDSLFVRYSDERYYDPELCVVTGCEIMAAKSAGEGSTDFTFHNAVGYIKYQIVLKAGEDPEEIDKIEISDKNGKDIAGDAKIVFDGTQIDTVRFISSGETSNTVTVSFDEGIYVTDGEPMVFYIPTAPMASGPSITITMKSGKAMTSTSSSPVYLGQILELPVIEFDPVTVAKVGEEEFYSIDKALEAANDLGEDATVTLLRNCVVGADAEVLSMRVITLDLNGKTLYSAGNKFFNVGSGNKECIIIDSSVEQTGMITNSNPGNSAMKIFGNTTIKSGKFYSVDSYGINMIGGTLTIEGGTIRSDGSVGLYCKSDANNKIDSVVVKGGLIEAPSSNGLAFNSIGSQLIFRGGSLQARKAGVYIYDGIAKFYGGFLGAKSNVVYANRSSSYNNQVDIYGGFYHRDSTTNSIVYGHTTTDSTRIWGGYYNVSPSKSYVASGYEIGTCDTTVNGINFSSTIIKSADVVCEITIDGKTVQKATINEAFTTALGETKPATIKLLANCATTDSIPLNGSHEFTLDLNGKTLTTPGTSVIRVNDGVTLTIKSSQEGGMMFESSTSSNSLHVRPGGKLILESGCLKGANSSAGHLYVKGNAEKKAIVEMNGGEIWTPEYNPVSLVSDALFIMRAGTLKTEKAEKYCIAINGNSQAEFYGGNLESESPEYKLSVAGSAKINGEFTDLAVSGAGEIVIEDGIYHGIIRSNASNLTINGGTFTNDGTTQALYAKAGSGTQINAGTFTAHSPYGTIRTHGTMVIEEGVTVIADYETNANALYVGDGASYPGALTVNGGSITGYKGAYVSGGVLSIKAGTFKSNQRAAYAASAGAVSISGGYFESPVDSAILVGNVDGAITGGWYTQPVPDSLIDGAYKVDSSTPITVGDVTYNYQVVENPDASELLSVNGTAYKTVSAAVQAINAAAGDVTITVLEECSSLNAIELSGDKTFTLDLNGKVLGIPFVSKARTFNITDNSTDANGRLLPANGLTALEINAGTTNFDKGFIESVKKNAVMVKGDASNKATFNFKGGEIISNTETTATADEDGGTVCVIDNSEFNMTGGIVRGIVKRALWCRSFTSDTYPTCNIHDGVLIAAGNVYYVYTRAHMNIDGGLFIGTGENAVCHNGTSNAEVEQRISGGFFTCGKSYDWSGYNDVSVGTYKFSGGYFTRSPKIYNSNTKKSAGIETVAGYSVAELGTAVTKEFEGVTYTFTHQIKKD